MLAFNVVRRPCHSDSDMLRRLINCRIIIIRSKSQRSNLCLWLGLGEMNDWQLSETYIGLSPVSIQTQSLALRALRLDGNRAKRKRLRWQAANHVCHFFDRVSYWLLHATHATQAIAFGWKPGIRRSCGRHELCCCTLLSSQSPV